MSWTLCANADAVAQAACARILHAAQLAISDRGSFKIVLAGGTTPLLCYRLLSAAASDWGKWHVYFGDERCLPPSDSQRNSMQAAAALLDRVAIPADQVHPIPAELGSAPAARSYTATITGATPFDLVLLGLGEDGHTASLFPDLAGINDPYRLTMPVTLNHLKHDRISMTLPVINNAKHVYFLVTGSQKAAIVKEILEGEGDFPAGLVAPRDGRLTFLLDAAAAHLLGKKLDASQNQPLSVNPE